MEIKMTMKKWILLLAALIAFNASAAITVLDDDGRAVTLQKPAMRVIGMAPHATELIYAAGGAQKIVAAVDYSDYPEAAKSLPRVGSNRQVDMERVASLKPDLIIIWLHGASERQIEQIRLLGIPMYHSEPKKLSEIPESLSRIGKLLGTESFANAAAADLRKQLVALAARYAGRPPVRMFYQVWDKPLHTLNGGHIVSDSIRLCGGENIYAGMKVTAPVVSYESVLGEDPEAIVSTAERGKEDGGVAVWKPYTSMTAVRRDNLFRIDGNLLNRAGPRMIAGTAILCEKLELARQRRKAS
jgi:iron complex transport system substrate-binding protein